MYRIALAVALSLSSSILAEEFTPRFIDLDTALQKVFDNAPSLVAAELETDIREAQAYQLSLWPNPEFAAEFDKVGGREAPDFNAAEYTYSLTQLIELGGKRTARINVAEYQKCVAEWEVETLKLDLRHQTISAMLDIFVEQEKVRLANQRKQTNEDILDSIRSKVEAGKLSIIQQHQAEIAFVRAEHAVEHSLRGFEASKFKLLALWNCPEEFDGVIFPFFDIAPPPPYCDLATEILNNPDVLRWDVEIASAEENYTLQRAEQIPDLLVTAGVVDIKDTGSAAATLEFVVPIPVFNRNQGNIAMSKYQICQAETKKEALIHSMNIDLSATYQAWLCSYHEALSIRDKILTKVTVSFEDVQEGYNAGKLELMDLLNAQNALADAEEAYILALMEYHRNKAHVERLIGKMIDQRCIDQ